MYARLCHQHGGIGSVATKGTESRLSSSTNEAFLSFARSVLLLPTPAVFPIKFGRTNEFVYNFVWRSRAGKSKALNEEGVVREASMLQPLEALLYTATSVHTQLCSHKCGILVITPEASNEERKTKNTGPKQTQTYLPTSSGNWLALLELD